MEVSSPTRCLSVSSDIINWIPTVSCSSGLYGGFFFLTFIYPRKVDKAPCFSPATPCNTRSLGSVSCYRAQKLLFWYWWRPLTHPHFTQPFWEFEAASPTRRMPIDKRRKNIQEKQQLLSRWLLNYFFVCLAQQQWDGVTFVWICPSWENVVCFQRPFVFMAFVLEGGNTAKVIEDKRIHTHSHTHTRDWAWMELQGLCVTW